MNRSGYILGVFSLLAACAASPKDSTGAAGAGVSMEPGVATNAGTSAPSGAGSAGVGTGGSRGPTGSPGSAGSSATSPSSAGNSAVGGTTAAASGSGGTAATGSMSSAGDVGNYFVSGPWHGYAWTSAMGMGTSVTPMDFSAQTTGMPRCVKGSVAATSDYSGNAMLGVNLNQTMTANAALMTATPTKAGVMLEVANNGSSPLRFQVQTPAGGTSGTWCIDVSGSGGFIPWNSLRTECWGTTGQAYANEPISAAMLLVPGTTMAAVPFDFCLNGLSEADGPTGGAAGSPAAGSGGATAGVGGTPSAGAGAGGSAGMSPPPLQGGCMGFASRYWDCCKPHCGWSANVPSGTSPITSCDRSDDAVGDANARNSCEGGPAHLCHSMVPWAVNDQLSYGFSAVAASGTDICGKCYQLQFTGASHNAGEDPGSAAIGGKTMIVQAINIGGDVGSGQFDISIPGGGVGMFNACSAQWGVPASELGQQYGGFLPRCKEQHGRTNHQALKSCVMQACTSVFESRGLTDLAAGCRWYVDWMQVADNPALMYKEVACPPELLDKGGVRRPGSPGNACVR